LAHVNIVHHIISYHIITFWFNTRFPVVVFQPSHGHHARRTQSALDKGKPDVPASSSAVPRHVDVPHISSSRRTPASTAGHDPKMVSASGPQRSLESPQPRHGVSRDNGGGGHAPSSAAFFQRQDSCPMMRDRGHGATHSLAGGARDPPGQYQDVSQITAVQVTPRPKPRAFPRTNPSYVSVHRRDGNPSAAFRHVDTMAASAVNHGYQIRGPERTASGRYYPPHSGAQTLQTSHSYLGSESGRRTDDVRIDDHDDADSDSSLSSSSSNGSNGGLRRQYTLDDRRPARHGDQSQAVASRSGAAGLVGISIAASRHAGGLASSEQSKSSESSPLVDHGPRRRPQRHARQPKSEPEIPPPPRSGAIPNGVLLPSAARRNSEPDYVNVPPRTETQLSGVREGIAVTGSTQSAIPPEQSLKSGERMNAEEVPRSGDGTLRIRDHVSPAADYVNCQDIVVTSSIITSGEQAIVVLLCVSVLAVV